MGQMRAGEIAWVLGAEMEYFEHEVQVSATGYGVKVGDGIARVHGLERGMAGELFEFPHGV